MNYKSANFFFGAVKSVYSKIRRLSMLDIGQTPGGGGANPNDVATWNGTNWVPDNTIVATTVTADTLTSVMGRFSGAVGAPDNGDGDDGDFYFRADGAPGARIYQKDAGAWVAII